VPASPETESAGEVAFVLANVTGNASWWVHVTIPHEVNLATMSVTGSFQFMAANGDMLSANFSGQGRCGANYRNFAALNSAVWPLIAPKIRCAGQGTVWREVASSGARAASGQSSGG
jgi:hypothetical protein